MQNRPEKQYAVFAQEVHFKPDFSIYAVEPGILRDLPITTLYTYPCLEIGYCHEGSGIVVVENKVIPFGKGDVTIIAEQELRYAQSAPKTQSRWTWIYLDPARLLVNAAGADAELLNTINLCGPEFVNVLKGEEHKDIVLVMLELIRELLGEKAGYRAAVRGLVLTLLSKLHRLAKENNQPADTKKAGRLLRILPALHHISKNYMNRISVDDLAQECKVSARTFRRLFLAATGQVVLDYITSYRVNMAGALLRSTENPILQISLDTGFPTLSSFNRAFKSHFEMSPRQHRKSDGTRK